MIVAVPNPPHTPYRVDPAKDKTIKEVKQENKVTG
jgi:hypothetical protein